MSQRPPRYDHGSNVDTRLSRLETIIDSISVTLDKITSKLDSDSKINWTPIGLGLTIFMAVVGSFSTIYTTRMNSADANIKALTETSQSLAVASTEQRITVQTLKDRVDDLRTTTGQRLDQTEQRMNKMTDRIRTLEGLPTVQHDND